VEDREGNPDRRITDGGKEKSDRHEMRKGGKRSPEKYVLTGKVPSYRANPAGEQHEKGKNQNNLAEPRPSATPTG